MGSEIDKPDLLTEGSYSHMELAAFKRKYADYDVYDQYERQLEELHQLKHPAENQDSSAARDFKSPRSQSGLEGTWAAYTWLNKVVHILNEEDYFLVRTNRNYNLLTSEEIETLKTVTVGVAGLSVGNSIARALDLGACCGQMVLADHDTFSLSNMNRVNIDVFSLGQSKLAVTIKQIYENNPYAKIKHLLGGISPNNLNEFFLPGRFIVFDEMDDFEMKVRLRLAAKDKKATVVMMTSLGDNVLVDIERHDNEEAEIFHGAAPEAVEGILSGRLSDADTKRYAAQLVGIDNVPTRALGSLLEVGQTLVGRPQLYGSVSVAAGLSCYVVREVVLNNSLPSGRYLLSFGEIFKLGRPDLEMNETRQMILKKLRG